jgi:hypothetical protein
VASDSFPSSAISDDVVDGFDHPIPACRIVAVTLPPALVEAASICRSMAVQSCVTISAGGQRIDRAVFYYLVGILCGFEPPAS